VGSTPPPGFDEAIRAGGSYNMYAGGHQSPATGRRVVGGGGGGLGSVGGRGGGGDASMGSPSYYGHGSSAAQSVRSHSTYSSNSSTVTSRQEVETATR
jgi:hypothetical protein